MVLAKKKEGHQFIDTNVLVYLAEHQGVLLIQRSFF
jgi:hypothetical protein